MRLVREQRKWVCEKIEKRRNISLDRLRFIGLTQMPLPGREFHPTAVGYGDTKALRNQEEYFTAEIAEFAEEYFLTG